ncbi:DUF4238 domain-containing protein [Terracidiphilus sp.]|uniref:DUF4238 domain-containing protein n=1 Tax=Terracidiphilus sp. TaxID=1964191 RepID=UPI003C23FDAB
MALTRDNHFVPQLYLKNFATATGEVLEYRTLVSHSSVPVWKSINVAGTGYEKNLYTRIVRGEEADDVEQWLNRDFESPAKEPLQKVLADQQLAKDDWEILVRFLAAQIVRTPAFLIKSLPVWNQMTPVVLDQTQKEVEAALAEAKASGREIIHESSPNSEYFPMRVDRKDLPDEKKVQFTTKVVVGRGLWFFSMKHLLTKTLEVLHKHKWTVLEAPAGMRWFTSDDPVICLNFRSESDYDFKGGWNRKGANILFPLSTRHLMITEIGAGLYPKRVPSRYKARLFRRIMAEHAHRRIYSLVEEEKIVSLRPRVVDDTAFRNERTAWESYYENQTRAEQDL